MKIKTYYPSTEAQLCELIKRDEPLLVSSAQTGTVIPYDFLEQWADKELSLVNLMRMPTRVEMIDEENVFVEGPLSWEELRRYLRSQGRDVLVFPTEQSASVLAGICTSCTGERSFAYGAFRDHLIKVEYLNYRGEKKALQCERKIEDSPLMTDVSKSLIKDYQADYKTFENFKNAPFPRLQVESDLFVGSEGQFGVATSAILKTGSMHNTRFLSLSLDRWQDDIMTHTEIFKKLQDYRGDIISVELLDSNALSCLELDERWPKNKDVIIIEVCEAELEKVYEEIFLKIESLDIEHIVELSEKEHTRLRSGVPRWVQEKNAKGQVLKLGTDSQFAPEKLEEVFSIYQELARRSPCDYTLFGHFGDLHLHFNFLAERDKVSDCQKLLEGFYQKVKQLKGSPFTEHGIGLLKQKYLKDFWSENQFELLGVLKSKFDPKNVFFPMGPFSRGKT